MASVFGMAEHTDLGEAHEAARLNLLNQIANFEANNRSQSELVLNLAEAYAWLTSVNQPHGGRSSSA